MSLPSPVQQREVEIVASVSLSRKDEQPISYKEVDFLIDAFNDAVVEFMERVYNIYFTVSNTKLVSPRREAGTEKFSKAFRKAILRLLDEAKSTKERERLKIKYHSILYSPDSRNKETK